jgi:hypothetical protein
MAARCRAAKLYGSDVPAELRLAARQGTGAEIADATGG